MNIQDIWSDLLSEKSDDAHGSFRQRLIHKFGFSIGLDTSTNQKIALVELTPDHGLESRLLPLWTGMEISINDFGEDDVLLLRLTGEEDELFDFLIDKLFVMIDNLDDKNDVAPSMLNFLERLDSFFKKYKKGLSEFQQQGLYGELYFLSKVLFKKIDPVYALEYWRGHKREHQDFLFPKGNVEVKTTTQKQHRTLTITSEKQLDERGIENLLLYALCLKKLDNSGQSLNEIIHEIREFLSTNEMDLHKFNRFLNDAGYFDEHEGLYNTFRYIVDEELIFKVKDEFPRIIDLPNGVGMNSYSIAISACREYMIDIDLAIGELIDGI